MEEMGGENLYLALRNCPIGQFDALGMIAFPYSPKSLGYVDTKAIADARLAVLSKRREKAFEKIEEMKGRCTKVDYGWQWRTDINDPATEQTKYVDWGEFEGRLIQEDIQTIPTKGENLSLEHKFVKSKTGLFHTRDWDTSAYFVHSKAKPSGTVVEYLGADEGRDAVVMTMSNVPVTKGSYGKAASCDLGSDIGGRIGFLGGDFYQSKTKTDECCWIVWRAIQVVAVNEKLEPKPTPY